MSILFDENPMTIDSLWNDESYEVVGNCANCNTPIEAYECGTMRDGDGHLFCDQSCLNEYWHNNYVDWSDYIEGEEF